MATIPTIRIVVKNLKAVRALREAVAIADELAQDLGYREDVRELRKKLRYAARRLISK